jgi:glycosyltransferase involved in cell wall biosynthesis
MQGTSIHIWVPGIREGVGGIQAFSRVYVQAIREAYPWARVRVFVKNDQPEPDDPLVRAGVLFYSVAHQPLWLRTLALVGCGLSYGLLERPACAVTTHLHFLPALRFLRWLRGVPIMSVLHGIEAWNLRPGPRVWAMRAADHLLAVSRFTRQNVIDAYGMVPERVSVVPNTFDTERFTPGPKPEHLLRRHGLTPDQPVLLTVSRLALSERYKGHRQVLAALDIVRREFPQVRHLIVGTGDDLPRLRDVVAARGLQEQVILAGHVPGEDLPDYYRLCDVFVMPSSKEGFGIVFLEAMATGKPVIAGNRDGSVDALDDGRLGLLVDPYNVGDIAAAICRALRKEPAEALWNDPDAMREAVAAQFGYPRVSRLLAEDLAPLLGREGRRVAPPISFDKDRQDTVPHILVVTQLTSPYQVEFFNELSATCSGCHLEVIYLTSQDRARQWSTPGITHNHLILSDAPNLRKDALQAVRQADLVVFNYYTDRFSLQAIHERARLGRPWVFWGERPGFHQTGLIGTLARWFMLRPLHQQAVPIWGVGRFGLEGYRKEFGHSRSYQNIPYFSNLKRFMAIKRPANAPRVFFYSGAFSHRKGGDLLAAAFVRVATRHPDARLVLLGTGPLEQPMRHVLQPCASQVAWLGFQPWEDLPDCYAQGSVFCFPSRYDGWGLAMVEALAAGMPAIGTSRTGAAVEFLADGRAGWLLSHPTAHSLAEAMEQALTLPEEEFNRMQQAARGAVSGESLESGVQRFEKAASEAIALWPSVSRATS